VFPDELLQDVVLGHRPVETLPDVAAMMLAQGHETLEMAIAALPDSTDPREIRELFEAALASVGRSLPTWEESAVGWLDRQAGAVSEGSVSVDGAARAIRQNFPSLSDEVDRLPPKYFRVVFAAGENLEQPWWREELVEALQALSDRA
jgi:hypothetical protein